MSNLGLVRAVALRYRNLGLSDEDLLQEGSIGLCDAIERFDARSGSEFPDFARWRVRRAILNALTDDARLVRLPKHVVERRRAVRRVEALMAASDGRSPSVEELAAVTGLSRDAVFHVQQVRPAVISLDAPLLPDGTTIESMLPDELATDPEAAALEHERTRVVRAAVRELRGRERAVIVRHFGLGRRPEQVAGIAADFHVSPTRIRAIERNALSKLRTSLERAGLVSDGR